jgi:mono/diheme cytochrome c family protein
MIHKITIAVVVFILIGAVAFWVLTIPKTVSASALGPHTPDPENGRTLFYAGGCASCHSSPQQEDKTRLGGGLALKSPFGTFYAPNISPDATDGIGSWTEAQFVTALKEGTSADGEHLYPAFPFPSYQIISFDDLRDLFAYLKTLPAARDRALETAVPLSGAVAPGSKRFRRLQPRRLPGQRRRPLPGMP